MIDPVPPDPLREALANIRQELEDASSEDEDRVLQGLLYELARSGTTGPMWIDRAIFASITAAFPSDQLREHLARHDSQYRAVLDNVPPGIEPRLTARVMHGHLFLELQVRGDVDEIWARLWVGESLAIEASFEPEGTLGRRVARFPVARSDLRLDLALRPLDADRLPPPEQRV